MKLMKNWKTRIFGTCMLIMLLLGIMPGVRCYAGEATCINADGSCQTGYLNDSVADDYYFQIKENGWARIGVSSTCSAVDFQLSKSSAFSSSISTDDNGYVYLSAGTYYVRVLCDKGHSCGEYTVSANFKATADKDPEPNDSREDAVLLTSGITVNGSAYTSANDRDWYKFEVNTLSMVHIAMPNVVTCRGCLYKDTQLVGAFSTNYNGMSTPFTLQPGTYYMQIMPSTDVGGDYTLALTIVEYPTENEVTSVQATGLRKAKITWSKSEYAEGYYLFRKADANSSWTQIAEITSGDTTSYIDNSAPYLGSSCIYGVQAYRVDPVRDKQTPGYDNNLYNQDDSEGMVYKSVVPAPKNVKVSKYTSYIKVNWDEVTGVSGYKVYRKANGGSYKLVKTISSGSTSIWKDTTVVKGTNYTYKVKAYYANGNDAYYSNYSSTAKAKITGTISAPKNVTAKKYSSYNKVTWNKVTGASGYKIYRKVGTGSYKLVKTTTSGSTLSYKDQSVKSGKKYTYKVKAYYKNYTYNSSSSKYTCKTVNSGYSKISSVKR